jgi:hypothetical protein
MAGFPLVCGCAGRAKAAAAALAAKITATSAARSLGRYLTAATFIGLGVYAAMAARRCSTT